MEAIILVSGTFVIISWHTQEVLWSTCTYAHTTFSCLGPKVIYKCLGRLLEGLKEQAENDFLMEVRSKAISVLGGQCKRDDFFVFKRSESASTSGKKVSGVGATLSKNPSTASVEGDSLIEDTDSLPAIIDIKVVSSMEEKNIPPGYTVLSRGFGGERANVNKGNGASNRVFLCYKRGSGLDSYSNGSKHGKAGSGAHIPIPITALAVVQAGKNEEPPYGATVVKHADKMDDADLNAGVGPKVNLCTFHGSGPPISSIGIVFGDKKDRKVGPSVGYHEIRLTPLGAKANLSDGTEGVPVFACFRPNITCVLKQYQKYSCPTQTVHYSECLATLMTCLYSFDQKVVALALESFRELAPGAIPPAPLNLFMCHVCAAVPCFLVYFTTKTLSYVLKFLLFVFKNYLQWLEIETVTNIFEACLLVRHEDKKYDASRRMVDHLLSRIVRCVPCPNHRGRANSSAAIGETLHVTEEPAAGPTCFRCKWKVASLTDSRTSFSRRMVEHMALHVAVAKEFHDDIKQVRRNQLVGHQLRLFVEQLARRIYRLREREQHLLRSRGHKASIGGGPSLADVSNSESSSEYTEESWSSEGTEGDSSDDLAESSDEKSDKEEKQVRGSPEPRAGSSPLRRFRRDPELRGSQFLRYPVSPNELQDRYEQSLYAIALMSCQIASQDTPFNLRKSERVKRRAQALAILLDIVQKSGFLFRSNLTGTMLLRNFIVPSLMTCCVTDVPSIFRTVIQIFVLLWDNLKAELMIELGVFFGDIFLNMLENPFCTAHQKQDVIDIFFHILHSPRVVVNLFFNFDVRSGTTNIYERLVAILSDIVQGKCQHTPTAFQPALATPSGSPTAANSLSNAHFAQSPAPSSAPTAPNSPVDVGDPFFNTLGHADDAESFSNLQRHCLRLLTQILQFMAQWVGVPGVDDAREYLPLNSSRTEQWELRLSKRRQVDNSVKRAVAIAKEKNLKAAILFMRRNDPSLVQIHVTQMRVHPDLDRFPAIINSSNVFVFRLSPPNWPRFSFSPTTST